MGFKRCKKTTREEWLKERGKGLGGSDIAALMGYDTNRTSIDLFNEKTGLVEREKVDNRFTEYGTKCERLLREMFLLDYPTLEVYHNENEILIGDNGWQRASLDGEIIVNEPTTIYTYKIPKGDEIDAKNRVDLHQGEKGILEIKTAEINSSKSLAEWHNQIPMKYYCQVLHYLLVTNYDFFILRAKLKFIKASGCITSEIRDYCVRKENLMQDIKLVDVKEKDFWLNHIEKKTPPSLVINL